MDSPDLAAMVFILLWFLMGPAAIVIMVYMTFYSNYYFIPMAYFLWCLYDVETKGCIKRRSDCFRKLSVWKHLANYFPMTLVATEILDPKKNYVIGLHPHGVLASASFNFASDATDFSQKFPGIKSYLLAHQYLLLTPFREVLISLGFCSATESNFNHILGEKDGITGNAVVLVPGGVQEMLSTTPGNNISLYLHKRKGFVRLALQNGASLVPVFTFGEHRLYNHWEFEMDSAFAKVQHWMKKYTGIPVMSVFGRFGLLPLRKPITTVVGSPIHCKKIDEPSQEEIDRLHEKYLTSLISLFNTYKGRYGDEKDELDFIC